MTVPPNYGSPPEQPQTPGYGYQNPYGGGQQQPQYGRSSQYGQAGSESGSPSGSPLPPVEPPRRNLGMIGIVVVGVTVILLGAVLLVTLNLKGAEEDPAVAGAEETSEAATEEDSSPEAEVTTPAEADTEVGQCLPYAPVVDGDGLELMDCTDEAAFWTITAQSYDVTDVPVDEEGKLTDNTAAYELCGDTWGVNYLGKPWTNWHYVFSSGTLDSLYCIEAVGNPDPENPDRTPYTPTTGDCFDKSDQWWTVDCDSETAVYEAIDVIEYDEPTEMSKDEAAENATCGGEFYWQVKDIEGLTTAIICGKEV